MTAVVLLRRCAISIPLALIAACTNLPDLSGYTAATLEVRSTVAAAGTAVSGEIGNAATTVEDPARSQIETYRGTYDGAWQQTVRAMDAMVTYAESIEAISAAGNKGKESALAVTKQVRDLAGALGVPLAPVAATLDLAAQTGAAVYGEIAKIEAARSLEAAIAASGPAIEKLQVIVLKQVSDSRVTFGSALAQQSRALRFPDQYGATLAAEEKLRTSIAAVSSDLTSLSAGDPRIDTLKAQLEALTASSNALAPRLSEYKARLDEIETRRKAGVALLEAAEGALEAWATEHGRLVGAIRDYRPVTLTSLNAAVSDLRDLIKQWREL